MYKTYIRYLRNNKSSQGLMTPLSRNLIKAGLFKGIFFRGNGVYNWNSSSPPHVIIFQEKLIQYQCINLRLCKSQRR